MIIWINGAFGSGKTTCSYEMSRRLDNSFVYDPEDLGYFIRKNTPKSLYKNDFQDYECWRKFNYDMLKYFSNSYNGVIIVPMTIINKNYYYEIIGRLENEGVNIKHFILYANKDTLKSRINKRFEIVNSWAKTKIDDCIKYFYMCIDEEKIFTDNKSIDEIIYEIAQKCNLNLKIDKRNLIKKQFDRFLITLKHII